MQMDRETLMMIATIVCIVGVVFLFKEMNKTKTEVENFRNFSNHLMHQLTAPLPHEDELEVEDVNEKGGEKSEE